MEINVKGATYNVKFVKHNFKSKNFPKTKLSGLTDLGEKKIKISTENKSDIPHVVYHELLHAFFWENDLRNYALDEVLVDWLALNFERIIKSAVDVMEQVQKEDV